MKTEELVEKFQCVGCVCGGDTKCGVYQLDTSKGGGSCKSHVLGTSLGLGNNIALGLPKGFCKPGVNWKADPPRAFNQMAIRLWESGTKPFWDRLNVPVWAMVEDGFLYVRTYAPRINETWVDVIENGSLDMVPNAINVGEFINEID